jgi:hypothetical protein
MLTDQKSQAKVVDAESHVEELVRVAKEDDVFDCIFEPLLTEFCVQQ